MSTVPADFEGKSDAELITAVRGGDLAAYGTLYERHVAAAYNLARQLARSTAECDDLVSDAFSKVLDTLRGGKGPDAAFRAYLLTTLRHTAYDKTRKEKKLDLSDDMSTLSGGSGPAAEALTVQFSDTAVAGLERTMAAKAFARLPERWQAVLWHTEIEQQTPAEVAPLLGLTPNGVSALAYRAREGLRQAYLQVHLAETSAERCRAAADKLGAWTRDGLSKRERAQVENHLDECDRCRALAAELADVNGALRAVVAPIVLGGSVFAYLAAGGAKASAATTAVAAASSSGAAAGAAAAGPRQFIGVAASGVAIAAAVATALASSGQQEIPTAAAQPAPPAQVAPAAPAPVIPAPAAPAPQPAPPAAPQVVPAPAPITSVPTPPPPPGPPQLTAQGPAGGVELIPGGGPVAVPITVRNDGQSVSDPVVASLNLPSGIRAVGPGGGGGGVGSSRGFSLQQADSTASASVDCPAGTGTVTCRTGRGLQPGESATLTFRLIADENAQPGEVTGSVSAGSAIRVAVNVPVAVKQLADGVALDVRAEWGDPWPWLHPSWVTVDVTNNGQTTKPVTVTVDQPAHLTLGAFQATCTTGETTSCTSTKPLAPNEHLRLWFAVDGDGHHARPERRSITVTAALGTATASRTVNIDCWYEPFCDGPPLPPQPILPTTTPSESPTTTTTTPSPTTTTTTTTPSTSSSTTTTTSSSVTQTTTSPSSPTKPVKPGKPWWWLPWIPW
ncbi:sigma-70 family RNA polymerase sigma factor [Amycolatopsis sp.]|uniref:sigma-70 family RNA polymerase sigma factor n=1 Tax=Amycolatopsis sp. TaxID=37632 RepID=UPI002C24D409|nr:sigma-70 family RNA polymerase sigma factor [Amycolatopsis sp.]HVV13195.1 sigma-70 family RNA polymerase sigma factor [Amycolatopsis sp.]